MKVVALGGAGDMGRTAVAVLAGSDVVDSVVIADKDLESARGVAARVGSKAVARQADAADERRLVELFHGADVVVSTCGPFFKFGLPAVRAAIAARVNYCDINDDARPTHEALALDSQAKAAGITALVGIGASPGLTNLLAKQAAAQLDRAVEIQTCWVVGMGEVAALEEESGSLHRTEGPNAAAEHMIYGCSRPVPTFRDGRLQEIIPFRKADGVEVDFPCVGRYTLYPVGHPEPVTLGRFIPGVAAVSNLGALYPPAVNDLIMMIAEKVASGMIDPGRAASEFRRAIGEDPGRWLHVSPETPPALAQGALCSIARGYRDRKHLRVSCALAGRPPGGQMAANTGTPLALAAQMLLRGEISAKGVLPPEACIDPMSFFRRYAGYWSKPVANLLDQTEEQV